MFKFDKRDAVGTAIRNPLERLPTDIDEAMSLAYDETMRTGRVDSIEYGMKQEYQVVLDQIEKLTGTRLINPMNYGGMQDTPDLTYARTGVRMSSTVDGQVSKINDYITRNKDALPGIEPLNPENVKKSAVDKALKARGEWAQASEYAGTGASIAGFAGSMAAGVTDPANIAATVAGMFFPPARGLPFVAREAALNAGAEVLSEPGKHQVADTLGIKRDLGDFATDVTIGAAFGAGFAGTVDIAGRGFDYIRSLRNSKNPQVRSAAIVQERGLEVITQDNPALAAKTAAAESGGNLAAKAATSSATGKYQFLESTWNDLAKETGVPPIIEGQPDPRLTEAFQDQQFAAYTKRSTDALKAAGLTVDDTNLYLSHFLGQQGAIEFLQGLKASPDAPATAFVSAEAATANRAVFFKKNGQPKTAQELYSWAAKKMGTPSTGLPETHIANYDAAMKAMAEDAPIPEPQVVPGATRAPFIDGLELVDPNSIQVDAKTFQFKEGGDAEGVTDRLKGVKKWEQDFAGVALVYEKADGHLQIRNRPAAIKSIVSSGGSPVIHDTSAAGLDGILDTGAITPNQAKFQTAPTVSVSRDFNNYSRYKDSPYRLIIDENAVGHKSKPFDLMPGDRAEAEQVYGKAVGLKAIKTLAINISNPSLLPDIKSGKLAQLVAKAKGKGLDVEYYRETSKEYLDPDLVKQTLTAFESSGLLPTKGTRYIADGHQRLGLAKQFPGAQLNARVLREAEGWTPEMVRRHAALKNIAEGTGSPLDAAKILRAARDNNLPPLPPTSALVKQGRALADLADEPFMMVVNGVVPENYGAIVGRLMKDPKLQEAAIRVLNKVKPDNAVQAETIVRQVADTDVTTSTQTSLFGDEVISESLFGERAKVMDAALKSLKKDKQVFSTLVSQADRIEGAGNRLSRETNLERMTEDAKVAELVQKLASRKGPISDALTAAARSLRDGARPGDATREFLRAVRGAADEGLERINTDGGSRSLADSQRPLEPAEIKASQEAFEKQPEDFFDDLISGQVDEALANGRLSKDMDVEVEVGGTLVKKKIGAVLDDLEADQRLVTELTACVEGTMEGAA